MIGGWQDWEIGLDEETKQTKPQPRKVKKPRRTTRASKERKIITRELNVMDLQQLKLYAINGSTLGVTTFTNIEMGLKIFLLIVTIGYTISKWIDLKKGKSWEKLVDLVKLRLKRSLKYGLSAYASGWGVRCTKAGGPSKMGKKKKK